jgi:Mlc titration factor MtfA (ptsG expression regulator)
MLKAEGLNPPKLLIAEPSFNQYIDDYLYEEVGYSLLNNLVNGLFVSAYAATSLSEYYARGFEEYVFGNRKYLAKTAPALYNVLEELFKEEE